MKGEKYTPEELALILAADTGEKIKAVAQRLGRSLAAVQSQRTLLRQGKRYGEEPGIKKPVPRIPPSPSFASRFARPSFFEDEDLRSMSMAKR